MILVELLFNERTTMADIILETVDLDVFGGPSSINISTDFGKTGKRGSRIWAGSGNPLIALGGQPVELYDLYINTSTSDQFYSWLYQYTPAIGGASWTPLLKINPLQYSEIATVSFTGGTGTATIPISNFSTEVLTNENLNQINIKYSIQNTSNLPIASSFDYEIDGDDLIITFTAVVFSSNSWSALGTSNKIHLYISYLSGQV